MMAEAPESAGTEGSGKTVDDAINRALSELALRREQVTVTVLSEGRPGILGVGSQPARVRVTPIATAVPPPPALARQPAAAPFGAELPATPVSGFDQNFVNQGAGTPARLELDEVDQDLVTESAIDVLETLLQLMGLDAEVQAREPETPGDGVGMIATVLDVTGIGDQDMGLLIGRRGETLAALQYMVNLIVNHQTRSRSLYGVDVEGYRRRRENALRDLAVSIADRVRQNGQAMTLEPMSPAERRIVHITLADDPDVQTVSIGEGDARKVAITPRQ